MRSRFVSSVLLGAGLVQSAGAQAPDTTRRASNTGRSGAVVSGMVRDSIGRVPLAGAVVQLVADDSQVRYARTVSSDSLGRFAIDGVPDGRYALGFFHPLLDSLGVEPPLKSVRVSRRRSVRVDLSTPSPAQLRAAICGPEPISEFGTGALLVGVVRETRGREPAAGVTVTGEWLEVTIKSGSYDRRLEHLDVKTGTDGRFAMCNVPSSGAVVLSASRGADSTDRVDVTIPRIGFLRRELYLGVARAVVSTADSALRADTLFVLKRPMRRGDGRLRGRVVTADGNMPLAGAMVRFVDGPQVRTNDRGDWAIMDAPAGTRMLEVRAIGYFPAHQPVDVVADAAPLTVPLVTFKAMLDTVKITVSRVSDRSNGGFELRRRSTMGRFVTAEDIERRAAVEVSDVFRMLPGVRVEGTGFERWILVRSAFGYCQPAVYIDGLYVFRLSADEIDGMVSAKDVRGIEIYGDHVPAEYQQAMSGCGAIVIWRK